MGWVRVYVRLRVFRAVTGLSTCSFGFWLLIVMATRTLIRTVGQGKSVETFSLLGEGFVREEVTEKCTRRWSEEMLVVRREEGRKSLPCQPSSWSVQEARRRTKVRFGGKRRLTLNIRMPSAFQRSRFFPSLPVIPEETVIS